MFIVHSKVRNKLSLGICIILCKCKLSKPYFKNFHTVHVPLSPPIMCLCCDEDAPHRAQTLRLGPLKISSRTKKICSLGLHLFSLRGRVMQGPGCASCVVCWGRLIYFSSAQPSPAQPSLGPGDGCGANCLCSRDLQWITRHQQLRCCFCVQDGVNSCRNTCAHVITDLLLSVVQYSVSRHLS